MFNREINFYFRLESPPPLPPKPPQVSKWYKKNLYDGFNKTPALINNIYDVPSSLSDIELLKYLEKCSVAWCQLFTIYTVGLIPSVKKDQDAHVIFHFSK